MIFHKGSNVRDYFSLVKISHTIFSLPFALIGFSLAVHDKGEGLNLRLLILVLLCVFFARNAAMGFNRFADREIDQKNPRTAFREIPKKIIRPGSALLFVLLNAMLFMVAAYMINLLCFFLAPVARLGRHSHRLAIAPGCCSCPWGRHPARSDLWFPKCGAGGRKRDFWRPHRPFCS